jgi:hypothetical protein
MRRVLGAVVVMGLIAAWNLAGQWFIERGEVHDIAPSAPAPIIALPVISSPRSHRMPARGKIVPASAPATFSRDPLVFLSTAPAESLDLLPGVGPVLASRIIDARIARGAFTSWNDVLAVKGIGPRTVARWQAQRAGQ